MMMIRLPICQAKKHIKSHKEGVDLFCNTRENCKMTHIMMKSPGYMGDTMVTKKRKTQHNTNKSTTELH